MKSVDFYSIIVIISAIQAGIKDILPRARKAVRIYNLC